MKLYWHDIERIRYNGSWIGRKQSISSYIQSNCLSELDVKCKIPDMV